MHRPRAGTTAGVMDDTAEANGAGEQAAMGSPNRVDTSTLGWVKDEIDRTLAQGREALRRYVDAGDDATALRLFSNNVHQVAGTLQMVELDGAAQLAQETEALAAASSHSKTARIRIQCSRA